MEATSICGLSSGEWMSGCLVLRCSLGLNHNKVEWTMFKATQERTLSGQHSYVFKTLPSKTWRQFCRHTQVQINACSGCGQAVADWRCEALDKLQLDALSLTTHTTTAHWPILTLFQNHQLMSLMTIWSHFMWNSVWINCLNIYPVSQGRLWHMPSSTLLLLRYSIT